MKWLLIYLICAMATAMLFGYIAATTDRDYYKTYKVAGVISTICIGLVFPASWIAVIVKAAKSYRRRREDIKELWRAHRQLKAMKRELEKEMDIKGVRRE